MRAFFVAIALMVACSSGKGGGHPGAVDTPGGDVPAVEADAAVQPEEVTETGSDAQEELSYPVRKLPFEFTRPADGDPPSAAEVMEFTRKVTGLWKKVDYFRWVLRTGMGVDASTGKEDFLAWYNDIVAEKSGDTVTFKSKGHEHNMWIPGAMILTQAINGCALTGDWTICKVAEQYCKGLTAVVKGFVWDENDPAPFLMARSIFPFDQSFTLDKERWNDDGRKKVVEFHESYTEDMTSWNARSFAWPHNPTWGSIWVTTMRSKDDVRAIVRTTTFLPYVVKDAKYDFVRAACKETLDTMVGFNKDIVDSGYYIRTKGPDGVAYKVMDQDLGNYIQYAEFDERNECPARLATDLIAYGERKTNDCGTGFGSSYEAFACQTHYYNYPIVWDFHMAALGNALVRGRLAEARPLLDGLAQRIDSYMHPSPTEPGPKQPQWWRDMAVLLVQAASMGLPLQGHEAKLIHKHWSTAVEQLSKFPNWDLWALPDGEYKSDGGIRPADTDDGIPVAAIALFLEYCNSPFKNPAGVAFVDCEVVKDTSRWGQ